MGKRITASFTWAPLCSGYKTRQPIKMNAKKDGKRGKMWRMGKKQPLIRWARLRESSIVWIFLFATAGVGFQWELRHITCFTSTTERAKRRPKLRLNSSRSLWSEIKPPHRSLIQRPFFFLSPSLSFHSYKAFVYCTNEPVISLLHFPRKNVKMLILRILKLTRLHKYGILV